MRQECWGTPASRWSWCACRAVLIVSLRLALKNSKKESLNCRFWSNWQLNTELSFNSVRQAERAATKPETFNAPGSMLSSLRAAAARNQANHACLTLNDIVINNRV